MVKSMENGKWKFIKKKQSVSVSFQYHQLIQNDIYLYHIIIRIYQMYVEQGQNIRVKIIETKFGGIYCRQVGQYGQPLILVIHGSGPKNSSAWYQFIMHEYLVRIAYMEKFYILAMDCPGYGHSGGSKQAIKTFPLELMQQILYKLDYKSYFALLGHSQGGAAIFNAVHQYPSLTQFMIQDRPVCGNIQRFKGFETPTLLIYDIQDDGHPIWQGKQLYKELKNSQLHTYRTTKSPYWAQDNIWDLMIEFFDKWSRKLDRKKQNVRARSIFTRQRQMRQTRFQATSLGRPQKKIKQIRQIEEDQQQQIKQISVQESIYSSSSKGRNHQRQVFIKKKQQQPIKKESPPKSQKIKQVKKDKQIVKIEQPQKPKQTLIVVSKKPEHNQTQTKLEENKCSICYQLYYHPTKINCNHVFCWKCITQTILVDPRCPLCRRDIQKRIQIKELHQQLVSKLSQTTLSKRELDYNKFNKMVQSIVFVQLGNTSVELQTKKSAFSNTKKKYNWQLFVIEPKNFKFQSVQFNINMGEVNAKPIKVRNAPWVFQSRGTFSFSCEITINPRSKQYAAQVVVYRIKIQQGRHSKKIALKKKQNSK